MKILILEPYLTGSHKFWAEGYQRHSEHEIEILGLPGNFWKWRMHGGAVTLAKIYNEKGERPDLILATDMLDFSTFLSLTRNKTSDIPTAVYFHENQLSYPWSPGDRDVIQNRDKHYGFINFTSTLVADLVLFNSQFHMQSYLKALGLFLNHFPDYRNLEMIDLIRDKGQVLSLGMDLAQFDTHKNVTTEEAPPLLLWNHRWEFDKNPSDFFQALFILAERDLDFNLAILGECFSRQPKEFIYAKEFLGDRIIQYGEVEHFSDYAKWLWRSDILPVTSIQDFFGGSVVEAIYCGCHPVLPNRLAYPGLIPESLHGKYLYTDFEEFVERMHTLIADRTYNGANELRGVVQKFDWLQIIKKYDQIFESLVAK